MKSTMLSLVLGATTAFGLGMAAEACSSSSSPATTNEDGGSHSSATGTASGTGATGTSGSHSSGTASSSGTGTTSAAGSSCYEPPGTKVYPPEDGGAFYCPFSGVGDAGAKYCAIGEHCCETESAGADCQALTTACAAKDTDWQCEGTTQCGKGEVCCGNGSITTQAAQTGCSNASGGSIPSYPYVSDFKGTTCVPAASCTGPTSFEVCSLQSDCGSGKCTPIKPKGNEIGYCVGGDGSGNASGAASSGGSATSGSSKSSSASGG